MCWIALLKLADMTFQKGAELLQWAVHVKNVE